LTKNQSKIFLKLSTQTIPTAPVIFPIKFNVLEVGGKNFKSKQAPELPEQKSRKNEEKSQKILLKCRKWHFLKNLSLQIGRASFTKERNQIPPEMHIK